MTQFDLINSHPPHLAYLTPTSQSQLSPLIMSDRDIIKQGTQCVRLETT